MIVALITEDMPPWAVALGAIMLPFLGAIVCKLITSRKEEDE